MVEKVRSELPGECVEVEPGTELDRVLTRIEADGGIVELLHGDARYQLLPITGDDDLERAWRRLMIARAWAIRDAQPPLGISTAQLVREARGEADGE